MPIKVRTWVSILNNGDSFNNSVKFDKNLNFTRVFCRTGKPFVNVTPVTSSIGTSPNDHSVTLIVTVVAYPTPMLTWARNGSNITTGGRYHIGSMINY